MQLLLVVQQFGALQQGTPGLQHIDHTQLAVEIDIAVRRRTGSTQRTETGKDPVSVTQAVTVGIRLHGVQVREPQYSQPDLDRN